MAADEEEEVELRKVSTTIRADEVERLDFIAALQRPPYKGNRAATIRQLIREALEARGI